MLRPNQMMSIKILLVFIAMGLGACQKSSMNDLGDSSPQKHTGAIDPELGLPYTKFDDENGDDQNQIPQPPAPDDSPAVQKEKIQAYEHSKQFSQNFKEFTLLQHKNELSAPVNKLEVEVTWKDNDKTSLFSGPVTVQNDKVTATLTDTTGGKSNIVLEATCKASPDKDANYCPIVEILVKENDKLITKMNFYDVKRESQVNMSVAPSLQGTSQGYQQFVNEYSKGKKLNMVAGVIENGPAHFKVTDPTANNQVLFDAPLVSTNDGFQTYKVPAKANSKIEQDVKISIIGNPGDGDLVITGEPIQIKPAQGNSPPTQDQIDSATVVIELLKPETKQTPPPKAATPPPAKPTPGKQPAPPVAPTPKVPAKPAPPLPTEVSAACSLPPNSPTPHPMVAEILKDCGHPIVQKYQRFWLRNKQTINAFLSYHDASLGSPTSGSDGEAFGIMLQTLEKHQLPKLMGVVTLIESNFGHSGCGDSEQSCGYWQLKAGTARANGILVNGKVDERKKIEPSTRAASNYYNKFKPTWTYRSVDGREVVNMKMFLESYRGEGHTGDQKDNRDIQKLSPHLLQRYTPDFWVAVTRGIFPEYYVGRILGAMTIALNPQAYGLQHHPISPL